MSYLLRSCLVLVMVCSAAVAQDSTKSEKKKKTDPVKTWSPEARRAVRDMIKTLKKMKSYQDEGMFLYFDPFVEGDTPQVDKVKQQLVFIKPDVVRYESKTGLLINDGKTVTAVFADLKRFRKRPLEKGETSLGLMDIVSFDRSLGVARIYLAEDPFDVFAKNLWNLEEKGRERVDKEDCVLLTGIRGSSPEKGNPINIWLRTKDGLIQKMELDTTSRVWDEVEDTSYEEIMNERMESMSDNPFFKQMMQRHMDERAQQMEKKREKLEAGLRVTETFIAGRVELDRKADKRQFTMTESGGFKKVDWMYRTQKHFETTALPLILSGKPIPEFAMDDLDGNEITNRQFKGKVGILVFDCLDRGNDPENTDWLDGDVSDEYNDAISLVRKLAREHIDEVDIASVVFEKRHMFGSWAEMPELTLEQVKTVSEKHKLPDPVIWSEENPLVTAMEINDTCVVLLKDEVVQGTYQVTNDTDWHKWLKRDVTTLTRGEPLKAGKKLSSRDIMEMRKQTDPMYVVTENETTDFVASGQLVEAWSVPATQDFGMPNTSSPDSRFWLTSHRKANYIGPNGDTLATVQIPDDLHSAMNPFSGQRWSNQYRFGFFGPKGRPASLLVKVPPPSGGRFGNMFGQNNDENEEAEPVDQELRVTVWDQAGEVLWTFSVAASENARGGMMNVFLTNLDGVPGQEICFTHERVLYVLSQGGDVLANLSLGGFNPLVFSEDRDKDGIAEIYVKTNNRLMRYDYEEDERR